MRTADAEISILGIGKSFLYFRYRVLFMNVDAIKEARDATPFHPFTIRTADGHEFEVPHHENLLVAEGGKTVIVATADEKFHILATDLVARISR